MDAVAINADGKDFASCSGGGEHVASPEAGAFFDTLAQFYRKAYLRWIDATSRRPDVRAARIAEVVDLLAAGIKERPRS